MSEPQTFAELLRAVRAGDQRAAAELVRRYEPAIRRVVRLRLGDARLRRVVDSQDICQAVLGSFFVRAALGQYDLSSPEQLLKLLLTMARNKLAKQVQQQRAARRDHRRLAADDTVAAGLPAAAASPSKQFEAKELLEEVRRRLTPEEWQLAEQRNQGYGWAEIAARVGGNPDALRIKLARAVKRVTGELGFGEEETEGK
jgi:RNA polymerase sigma-70 factor (ECF subfamily)